MFEKIPPIQKRVEPIEPAIRPEIHQGRSGEKGQEEALIKQQKEILKEEAAPAERLAKEKVKKERMEKEAALARQAQEREAMLLAELKRREIEKQQGRGRQIDKEV